MDWVVVGLCSLLVIGLIAVALWCIVTKVLTVLRIRNCVWCVCEVDDRVGLVPRDVFDRESRKFWRTVRRCKKFLRVPSPRMICPPESKVIVVHARDFVSLKASCRLMLEQRYFYVPTERTPLSEVYQRLYGMPHED